MNPIYDDLTSRIAEPPSWWQEGGVPRWGEFHPQQASSIYACEIVLMEIACQSCGTIFRVSMCGDATDERGLSEQLKDGSMHYGDPPNTGCCATGASMNSVPVRVLEYWSTRSDKYINNGKVLDVDRYLGWERDPLLEGPYQGWAGPARPVAG